MNHTPVVHIHPLLGDEEERISPHEMKSKSPLGVEVEPFPVGHHPNGDEDEGSVAVAAILAAIAVLCLTSGVAYIIYRYYRKRSVHSMNFDNPVYKKTTTEDGFNMSGGNQRPSSSQNGVRPAPGQTPYQHRQYGVMSSEDSLEPLTKNHQFV